MLNQIQKFKKMAEPSEILKIEKTGVEGLIFRSEGLLAFEEVMPLEKTRLLKNDNKFVGVYSHDWQGFRWSVRLHILEGALVTAGKLIRREIKDATGNAPTKKNKMIYRCRFIVMHRKFDNYSIASTFSRISMSECSIPFLWANDVYEQRLDFGQFLISILIYFKLKYPRLTKLPLITFNPPT